MAVDPYGSVGEWHSILGCEGVCVCMVLGDMLSYLSYQSAGDWASGVSGAFHPVAPSVHTYNSGYYTHLTAVPVWPENVFKMSCIYSC